MGSAQKREEKNTKKKTTRPASHENREKRREKMVEDVGDWFGSRKKSNVSHYLVFILRMSP